MLADRYRHFLAASETLHFTRAAERVFRTQSAISQSIAGLEAELGIDLFYREGKHLRLTEAGTLLQQQCLRIESLASRCRAELAELGGMVTGKLRIGASSTTACYWLPTFLSEFRGLHPGIALSLHNGSSRQLVAGLRQEECDLALLTLPVDEAGLDITELGSREDVLICAPQSSLLRRRPPAFRDLEGCPFLMPAHPAQSRQFLEAAFQDAGFPVSVSMEIRGLEIIKRYVEQDFGVSVVPRLAVESEVKAGTLEAWSVFLPQNHRRFALAQMRRSQHSPASRAFRALLLRRLTETLPTSAAPNP